MKLHTELACELAIMELENAIDRLQGMIDNNCGSENLNYIVEELENKLQVVSFVHDKLVASKKEKLEASCERKALAVTAQTRFAQVFYALAKISLDPDVLQDLLKETRRLRAEDENNLKSLVNQFKEEAGL